MDSKIFRSTNKPKTNKMNTEEQNKPPQHQQQVIIERGYTLGRLCLYFCTFILGFFMISLLACSIIVGGGGDDLIEKVEAEGQKVLDKREAEKQEKAADELRAIVERERELLKSIQ